MKSRTLGNSGPEVSAIIPGTTKLTGWKRTSEPQTSN